MEMRYLPHRDQLTGMSTEDLRRSFVFSELFKPDAVSLTYVDVDRAIVGSAVPVDRPLPLLASKKEMAAETFCERREVGVINIGGAGTVTVDGKDHPLKTRDGLYIGRGAKEVIFKSADKNTPAQFYLASYPSHQAHPTTVVPAGSAETESLGDQDHANRRTIHRYIHLRGVRSSQLVMGMTDLSAGSIWNTMPVHTHQRRSEIYMYFDMPDDAVVFHLVGSPSETRHVVLRNREAVAAPSWSIHSGVGTQRYSFIWAMGGENQTFEDMDGVPMKSLS